MLLQIHEPGKTPEPHSGENNIAVGIDLGTTNSLIAISRDEKPTEISNEFGEFITPSQIFLNNDNEFQVGKPDDNMPSISSAKRLMGKNINDVEDISKYFGYNIDQENSDKIIQLNLGDKKITPIEFSSKILSKLRFTAENALSKEISKAVITVPAYFNESERQATKDAAKLANLEVLRLINEPTAAALAYGLDKGSEGIYAVYDLGGGTFDVSILRMKMGVFKVIATGGDTNLGGDDFDIKLAEMIESKISDKISPQQLKEFAKTAKEKLSNTPEISLNINDNNIKITKSELEQLISPIVDKTIEIFESVIDDADLEIEDIKGVILVGGSTRTPLVKEKIEELIEKEPLSDIDPDKVVAFGAAIQAEALTRGSENLLLDVTPLSIGIETYGGLMEVVIGRNTPIPTQTSQKFTTYEDGQSAMKIHILQGERELSEDCRSLAEFDLSGIPPKPAGAAVIEVTFNIDTDGMLTVSATEETTGISQTIEVKPSYGIDSEIMEKMLLSSMEQAKDDIFKRLLREARVEAETVIKTLESGLSEDKDLISEEYYSEITNQIAKLQELCKGSDREIIEHEAKKLDELGSDFADLRISKALKGYLGGKKVDEI